MKHLKTYNLFESNYLDRFSDSIKMINNIKDILLELEDNDEFKISLSTLKDWTFEKEYEIEEVDGRMLPKNRADYLEVHISTKYSREDKEGREIPGAPTPPGGKYPSTTFLWFEVKDVIIRLCEYYYSEYTPGIDSKTSNEIGIKYKSNSPFRASNAGSFRMFDGRVEFGIGWTSEEDFKLDDFTSFTSLNLIIKLID